MMMITKTILLRYVSFLLTCLCIQVSTEFIAPTELKYLWVTPIQISSLLGHSINVQNSTTTASDNNNSFTLTSSFINDLADLQWFHFQDFCEDKVTIASYRKKYDLHDDALLSDVFYFYQLEVF
jgi:hypothetical protein